MLRRVVRLDTPKGGRQTILLKCGHYVRRDHRLGSRPFQLHCSLCEAREKEYEATYERKARKKKKRLLRKLKLQLKVRQQMKKKTKKASSKVKSKESVKKMKKEKSSKKKPGRQWYFPGYLVPQTKILIETIKAFKNADDQILGENELMAILEKAGIKDEGKKTVKKQMKAMMRNLFRAGVTVKKRGMDDILEKFGKKGKAEDEDEDEEEMDDEEEADDEETDDEEESDESEEDDKEEKPKKKKKLAFKSKKSKK